MSETSVKPLSDAERQRAAVYEAAIEAAFAGDEARVLAAEQYIKEELYREKYGTAENWCLQKWGKSIRRMQELIQAARVRENLSSLEARNSAPDVPENEEEARNSAPITLPNTAQATKLAKLEDPEDQRAVWEEVMAGEEPVTAKKVEEAVEAYKAEKAGEEYPLFQSPHWPTGAIGKAKRALEKLNDGERQAVVSLMEEAGTDTLAALRVAEKVSTATPMEREEFLRLSASKDERERDAAAVWAFEADPVPDPRLMECRRIIQDYRGMLKRFPNEPEEVLFNRCISITEQAIESIKSRPVKEMTSESVDD